MNVLCIGITVAGLVLTASGSCPREVYHGPLGCAVQDHCPLLNQCASGERCCPFTCGARCVPECPAVNCGGKTCGHSGFNLFAHDSRGCPTCNCATGPDCHTLSCLLHGGTVG